MEELLVAGFGLPQPSGNKKGQQQQQQQQQQRYGYGYGQQQYRRSLISQYGGDSAQGGGGQAAAMRWPFLCKSQINYFKEYFKCLLENGIYHKNFYNKEYCNFPLKKFLPLFSPQAASRTDDAYGNGISSASRNDGYDGGQNPQQSAQQAR
jgi:hypothetical protein